MWLATADAFIAAIAPTRSTARRLLVQRQRPAVASPHVHAGNHAHERRFVTTAMPDTDVEQGSRIRTERHGTHLVDLIRPPRAATDRAPPRPRRGSSSSR